NTKPVLASGRSEWDTIDVDFVSGVERIKTKTREGESGDSRGPWRSVPGCLLTHPLLLSCGDRCEVCPSEGSGLPSLTPGGRPIHLLNTESGRPGFRFRLT